ncbi:uncharacterized protein LOC117175201 isoform X2 [Belonocnema kinseyi]|nr:uncharacterized protein LOC117175201 isoform X2 [Belonocnema kinseyi]XP_033220731.1 uncharacterized protein LOC117175201 isoform X2 [Belonocnema kinseyi]XP_033220732.1 uncharacterized protein LOC117175201 isoform X2 [Belonocnema kinseyi]
MDISILRTLLISCNEVWKDVESSDEWKTVERTNRFPITDHNLLRALTTSLVNLLSYKVSREISQRYAVRLHIIEILREWSRVQGSLKNIKGTFTDGEKTLKFATQILEKYLTVEFLKDTKSVDTLMILFRALKCLLPKNPSLLKHLHKILYRLADLEFTEESEQLLVSITESKEEDLEIDLSLLERIYSSQRHKFIEKPLTEAYILSCCGLQDPVNIEQKLDKLFERMVHSPLIFQLASSFVREIFVAASYSQEALNFIKFILESIISRCKRCEKDIVDLYPMNLQSCAILLRIKPESHSKKTILHTMRMLKDIFLRCNEDALILVSHFPDWLEIFSSFLVENGYDLPNSQIENQDGD